MQIPTSAPQASVADSGGLHILLVDDSDADRTLMAAFLRPIRCTIDFACNGQVGVALFLAGHYDVVLMDYEMPVMTGPEAAREIRRLEREAGVSPVPILAFTAHTLTDVALKARAAGFTDLLAKPIRREVLLQAIAFYGGQAADAPQAKGDVEELVPAYLSKRLGDVQVYRSALLEGNLAAVRNLGHRMKGTGSGYGFPRLTEFGSEIEAAAIRSDVSALRGHVEEFALYLERVTSEPASREMTK